MPDLETLVNIENEVNAVLNDLGIPEKLSEMDDFMNQNDLKVSITNENAVTTGLVTYACTVKDADNNALANRVVEWYEGTTLVGLDATNSSGVSTFSHRVTTASIFDVHAVVRGTHAGDDIRMFVKDKNNLYPTKIWCAGEISDLVYNTDYLSPSSSILSISDEWSDIGNKSIKLNGSSWVRFPVSVTADDVGKTATIKAKCYVPSGTMQASIMLDSSVKSSVELPATPNTPAEISITTTILEGSSDVKLHLKNNGNIVSYVDNIELVIS